MLSCGAPTRRTGPLSLPTWCWATLNPKKVWSPDPTFTTGALVSKLNPSAGPGWSARAARRARNPGIMSSHSRTISCHSWSAGGRHGGGAVSTAAAAALTVNRSRFKLLSLISPALRPLHYARTQTGNSRLKFGKLAVAQALDCLCLRCFFQTRIRTNWFFLYYKFRSLKNLHNKVSQCKR